MAKTGSEYIVTHLRSGNKYETTAVSSADAINHIHYNLWFKYGIWTEMGDFEAMPKSVIAIKKLSEQHKKKQAQPKYHQMTLFEVSYDS